MSVASHLGGHCGITHVDEGAFNYLVSRFNVHAMFDVGCGPGGMLDLAEKKGVSARGVDGDYTVGRSGVWCHDFTQGVFGRSVMCGFEFDLIWSVEFLEHVEEKYLHNCTRCFQIGKVCVVTAAPPGKSGHHHVNCRGEEYWKGYFKGVGFQFLSYETRKVRECSTMTREFMRETGLVFERI